MSVRASWPLAGGVHHNQGVEIAIGAQVRRFVVRIAPQPQFRNSIARAMRPYDIASEFHALRDLNGGRLRTPAVWGLDAEGEMLGEPCFLMEHLDGPTVLDVAASDPAAIHAYVSAIREMNSIGPTGVPSVRSPEVVSHRTRGVPDSWISAELSGTGAPALLWRAMEFSDRTKPPHLPDPAFTNGDLGPANFILCTDGRVGVVDWDFVGFSDPLAELMLLHWWPPERPFLSRYPVDKLYCQSCGYDAAILPWYRLNGAIYGWLQAALNARADLQVAREAAIRECLRAG